MATHPSLRGLVILLGLSVITALLVNHVSPVGIALVGQWDTDKGVVTANAKDDVVVHELEIGSISQAKRIFDRGDALFVDARPEEVFRQGHIAGAVSLPLSEADMMIEGFWDHYPLSTPIITYCSGRECTDSHELADFLLDTGYSSVRVFIDGYPSWHEAGYPVE